MIPRQSPPADLLRLAELQAGALSAEQVAGFGFGRKPLTRMLSQQAGWRRLSTGLYLVNSSDPSWQAKAWGGVLLGGPAARLGGRAAGHLWGLSDEPHQIEVLVPADRTVSRPEQHWTFIREATGLRLASTGSPPRIGIDDAVLDLCAEMSEREVIGPVTSAIQGRRTTARRLARRLEQRGRVRHRRMIRELLAEVGEGAESPLEVRYLRDVERRHALPRGRRQHAVGGGREVRDVYYQEYGVVVELDGRLGHEGMGRFRDMRRDNGALFRGEVTLRYGRADLHDRSCPIAWQVAAVLIRRGWPGLPRRCAHCALVPPQELGVA